MGIHDGGLCDDTPNVLKGRLCVQTRGLDESSHRQEWAISAAFTAADFRIAQLSHPV